MVQGAWLWALAYLTPNLASVLSHASSTPSLIPNTQYPLPSIRNHFVIDNTRPSAYKILLEIKPLMSFYLS